MSYRRYIIDLAFKEPIEDNLQGRLTALEAQIRNVKASAGKIGGGNTVTATVHRCRHDEDNSPCNPQEI